MLVVAQPHHWVELLLELGLFAFGVHLDHDGLRAEDGMSHLQSVETVEAASAAVARKAELLAIHAEAGNKQSQRTADNNEG